MYGMVASVLVVYLSDCVADSLTVTTQHHKSIILLIAGSGNDQSSQLHVQFVLNFCFCKAQNYKLNHCKSGTVCK